MMPATLTEKRVKIGEILLSEGKITRDQLDEALTHQADGRKELGKILHSLGYISDADLAEAIAKRLKLEYVEITEKDVERKAASLVDQRVLRKHGALPLRIENGRLIVAMSDPSNFYALELGRHAHHLSENPVDAQAHHQLPGARLDVDV
jgi:type IV pilus assembly protein PilB